MPDIPNYFGSIHPHAQASGKKRNHLHSYLGTTFPSMPVFCGLAAALLVCPRLSATLDQTSLPLGTSWARLNQLSRRGDSLVTNMLLHGVEQQQPYTWADMASKAERFPIQAEYPPWHMPRALRTPCLSQPSNKLYLGEKSRRRNKKEEDGRHPSLLPLPSFMSQASDLHALHEERRRLPWCGEGINATSLSPCTMCILYMPGRQNTFSPHHAAATCLLLPPVLTYTCLQQLGKDGGRRWEGPSKSGEKISPGAGQAG